VRDRCLVRAGRPVVLDGAEGQAVLAAAAQTALLGLDGAVPVFTADVGGQEAAALQLSAAEASADLRSLTAVLSHPLAATLAYADLGLAVDLREAQAERLPFDNASFDTVVCTLSLCSVTDDRAAIGEMHRVLRPGGQLLLLDHVAATNRILLALQRLWEKVTLRMAGDYQTLRVPKTPSALVRRPVRTRGGDHRGIMSADVEVGEPMPIVGRFW
jgi:SAM-dependent methyltransferase